MDRNDFLGETATYRCVSSLDCLGIAVLLTTAFTAEERRKILSPYVQEGWREYLDDEAWVLLSLHRMCHTPNELSQAVTDTLEERLAAAAGERCAQASRDAAPGGKPSERHTLPNDALFIWALLREREHALHEQGNCAVHGLLCRLAGALNARSETGNSVLLELQAENAALKNQLANQLEAMDCMLDYIHQTRPLDPSSAFGTGTLSLP